MPQLLWGVRLDQRWIKELCQWAEPFRSHFPDVRMPQGPWKGLHLRAVVQSAVVEALRLRLGGARLALPLFL